MDGRGDLVDYGDAHGAPRSLHARLLDAMTRELDTSQVRNGAPKRRSGALSRLLERLVAPGVLVSTVTSTGVIAQQVAGKAIRDALFLGNFRAIHLPHAMAAGAVLSLVAVVAMPAVTGRVSPRRLMPALFVGSAVAFVLEWLLFTLTGRGAALALYLHTSVVGPLLLSTFWSLINERFDPHTAKRSIATIASGGTVGGLLGGLAVWRASSLFGGPSAVLLLVAINVACALGVLFIPTKTPESRRVPLASNDYADPRAAAGLLRTTPLLRNLALLVALSAVLSSLLDYVLGTQAVARYGRGAELMSFFSVFGLVVSVVSLFLQVSLGRLAMEKVGLATHLAVLPAVIALGGAAGFAVPGLASASILRGAEMVHHNTLFRSAYELLYTPISEAKKRATKAIIDVGFDRVGTFVGSLLTMAVIYTTTQDQKTILGIVVVLALSVVPVVIALHFGYVAALKERLLEGAAVLGSGDEIAPASVDPDEGARERLIGSAEAFLGNEVGGPIRETLDRPNAVLELGTDLLSGDETRARAALAKLDESNRAAAGHALVLLSHPTLHRDARFALRRIAPFITGQLIDILLAADVDVIVRRRIPPILAGARTQRAVDGLLLALVDARFEVRYAAGRTLLRLIGSPNIHVPKERMLSILHAEAKYEERWTDDDESLSDDATAPLDIVLRDRVTRGLEHVFNLLSCLIDGEAVRLCFRALHQDDNRYRGAALEYLQTALPSEIRDAVWPLLGDTSALVPSPRPAAEVLADLTKAIHLTSHERTSNGPRRRPAEQPLP
jgi:AAA family ATP:ADP antiporter